MTSRARVLIPACCGSWREVGLSLQQCRASTEQGSVTGHEDHPVPSEPEAGFRPAPGPSPQVKGAIQSLSQRRVLLGTWSLYCFSHIILNPQPLGLLGIMPFNLEKMRSHKAGQSVQGPL